MDLNIKLFKGLKWKSMNERGGGNYEIVQTMICERRDLRSKAEVSEEPREKGEFGKFLCSFVHFFKIIIN